MIQPIAEWGPCAVFTTQMGSNLFQKGSQCHFCPPDGVKPTRGDPNTIFYPSTREDPTYARRGLYAIFHHHTYSEGNCLPTRGGTTHYRVGPNAIFSSQRRSDIFQRRSICPFSPTVRVTKCIWAIPQENLLYHKNIKIVIFITSICCNFYVTSENFRPIFFLYKSKLWTSEYMEVIPE